MRSPKMSLFSLVASLLLLSVAVAADAVAEAQLAHAAASSAVLAATVPDQEASELGNPSLVDPLVLKALQQRDRIGVRVYYIEEPGYAVSSCTLDREISPVLADLASGFLTGSLSLIEGELVRAVRGTVDAGAIEGLVGHSSVVWIALDEAVAVDGEESNLALGLCSPSSTVACVHGNRFGITSVVAGANASVAASSSQSAVFWRHSSSNWEVIGKVLNGCAVNGKWWVFAAGATSSSWSITVTDYVHGNIIPYSGCPAIDTNGNNLFPCP